MKTNLQFSTRTGIALLGAATCSIIALAFPLSSDGRPGIRPVASPTPDPLLPPHPVETPVIIGTPVPIGTPIPEP